MHVLFIIDKLTLLKPHKDTSVAMMAELQKRGYQISVTGQEHLYMQEGLVTTLATQIKLDEAVLADQYQTYGQYMADTNQPYPSLSKSVWYELGLSQQLALSDFTAVIMRKDPPFDLEYLYTTHLLDRAQAQGAQVFNRGRALRDHSEKLAIAEFSQYVAPTLVSRDMDAIRAFHRAQGDIVVKPLDGMGGSGVFRLAPQELNRNAILESLTQLGTRSIMAQKTLPAIAQGDKRILLIGGKPVPFALARIPLAGETRGNLAAGGRAVAQRLTERDLEIAQTLGPILLNRGLLLVGLDVIGDYLTEINVTSPTCFVEISLQTGWAVAPNFVDALELAIARKSL